MSGTVEAERARLDFPLEEDLAGMVESIGESRALDPVVPALQGVEVFLHLSGKTYLERPLEVSADIRGLCRALVRAKPGCAPLVNLANDMIKPLANFYGRSEGEAMREDLRARAEAWRTALLDRERRRILKAAQLVGDGTRLLCYGFGMDLVGALRQARAAGVAFHVASVAGPPPGKASALADELERHDVACAVVAPRKIKWAAGRSSLVLLGACALTDTGFIHWRGSRPLAGAAREAAVPCYVLAGPEKFFPVGYPHPFASPETRSGPRHRGNATVGGHVGPVPGLPGTPLDVTPLAWASGVVAGERVLSGAALTEALSRNRLESLLQM